MAEITPGMNQPLWSAAKPVVVRKSVPCVEKSRSSRASVEMKLKMS